MKLDFFSQNMKINKIIFTIFLIFAPNFNLQAQILDSNFYNWKIYEIADEDPDFKKCSSSIVL